MTRIVEKHQIGKKINEVFGLILSQDEAARIIINNHFLSEKKTVNITHSAASIIEKLGYVQIDSIARVNRAHHHIIWSREERYTPEIYDNLLKGKLIFEHWGHAMSILPMKDFAFHKYRMENFVRNKWFIRNYPRIKDLIPIILDRIKGEGPLSSRDFSSDQRIAGGWNTIKPAKLALHLLQLQGTIMVSHRKKFNKYYDLKENILPSKMDKPKPRDNEIAEYVIDKALTNLIIASSKEICDYLQIIPSKEIKKALLKDTEEGQIKVVTIKGLEKKTFYIHGKKIDQQSHQKQIECTKIISPFDNIVIHRNWLENLFSYYFRLECYLPKNKRKFGIFSLPILHNHQFIGKIDCSADKKQLKINNLELPKYFLNNDKNRNSFGKELNSFCRFNHCDEIVADENISRNWKKYIQEYTI